MPAVIFSGDGVKALKNRLKLKDDAHIVSGSDDPTVVAISAPQGSIYLRTTGQMYVKEDAGLSTNWKDETSGESILTWTTGVLYRVGEIIYEPTGMKLYVCNTQHTAGATFAGDVANWDEISSTHTHNNLPLLQTYTQTEVDIADAIAKEHTHANKALLDTYTQTEIDIADAIAKEHTHNNLALLETYTQTEIDIADAISKEHTHNNLSLLETYTQTEIDIADAIAKEHTHNNLALLETYTQTEVDIADAISKEHVHANKALLDTYDQTNVDLTSAVDKTAQITINRNRNLDQLEGDSDIFYMFSADEDSTGFTTGNNATWDNGGVLDGTLVEESVTPLDGIKSMSYTSGAASTNDWIASPVIAVPRKARDRAIGIVLDNKFSATSSDEYRLIVKDITNGVILTPVDDVLDISKTSPQTYSTTVYIPANCTQIKYGFHVISSTGAGLELIFDQVKVGINPYPPASAGKFPRYDISSYTSVNGLTITGANARPFLTPDGTWMLEFNIESEGSGTASHDWTVVGIVFAGSATTPVRHQSIVSNSGSSSVAAETSIAQGSTNVILTRYNGNASSPSISGSVEITGRPTWATETYAETIVTPITNVLPTRVSRVTTQAITTAGTIISWDNVEYDEESRFNTSTGEYTAKAYGSYNFDLGVHTTGVITGYIDLLINSVTHTRVAQRDAGIAGLFKGSTSVRLNKGDIVQFKVYPSSNTNTNGTTSINWLSVAKIDGNASVAAMPKYHSYSSDEKIIGTWIDGKTVYEKSFDWTGSSSGNVSIGNIGASRKVTSIEGSFSTSTNSYSHSVVWSFASQLETHPVYTKSTGDVSFANNTGPTVVNITMTIRYTKN